MKILICLILFSSIAFAEVRVDIQSQKEGHFWRDFADQTAADAYIAEVTANNHWGQPGTYTLTKQDATALYQQARDDAASFNSAIDVLRNFDSQGPLTASMQQTFDRAVIKILKDMNKK